MIKEEPAIYHVTSEMLAKACSWDGIGCSLGSRDDHFTSLEAAELHAKEISQNTPPGIIHIDEAWTALKGNNNFTVPGLGRTNFSKLVEKVYIQGGDVDNILETSFKSSKEVSLDDVVWWDSTASMDEF